jgi:hypothetical protein
MQMHVGVPATGAGNKIASDALRIEGVALGGDNLGILDVATTFGSTDGAPGDQANRKFFQFLCQGCLRMRARIDYRR